MILHEWPTSNFGYLIDHFGSFTTSGVSNKSFTAIARSILNIEDFEVGEALMKLQQSNLTDEKAYVFPLPARVANLFTPLMTTHKKDKVGGVKFEK